MKIKLKPLTFYLYGGVDIDMLTRDDFIEEGLAIIDIIEDIRKDTLLFEKNMSSFLSESNIPDYIGRIFQHLNTYVCLCFKGLCDSEKLINHDDFMQWFWKEKKEYKDLDLIGFLDLCGYGGK